MLNFILLCSVGSQKVYGKLLLLAIMPLLSAQYIYIIFIFIYREQWQTTFFCSKYAFCNVINVVPFILMCVCVCACLCGCVFVCEFECLCIVRYMQDLLNQSSGFHFIGHCYEHIYPGMISIH